MPNAAFEIHLQKNTICLYPGYSSIVFKYSMYYYVLTFSMFILPYDLYESESFALMQ